MRPSADTMITGCGSASSTASAVPEGSVGIGSKCLMPRSVVQREIVEGFGQATLHRPRLGLRQHRLPMCLEQIGRSAGGLSRGVERPAEMLARMPQADVAMMRKHLVVELLRSAQAVLRAAARLRVAVREIARDLSGQPRPALRRATDHDRIGAGLAQRLLRVLKRFDVAVDHHRDRHRLA